MKIKSKVYDYKPIGVRIKNVRKSLNLTQEYLAEKLNVSCQHISDIERGLNGLSVPSLMELCSVLNVKSDYILFGEMSSDSANPIDDLINQMTPAQRLYAEEILTAYAKSCGIK